MRPYPAGSGRRSPRRTPGWSALLAGALVIAPVLGLASFGAAASPISEGGPATVPAAPGLRPGIPSGAPGTGGPGIGFVVWTLCLGNNDLLGGLQSCGASSLEPTALLWDGATGSLFTETSFGNLTVLTGDPLRLNRTLELGGELGGLALDPSNGNLVVDLPQQGGLVSLNASTGTVQQTVQLGGTPLGIAFDPADGYAFVTDALASSVAVLDSSDLSYVNDVAVGGEPGAAVWDPQDGLLYVVNGPQNAVDVVAPPGLLVGTLAVGGFPDAIAVDPSNGLLFVSNRISNSVSVIQVPSDVILRTLAVGPGPAGLLVDPARHFVYVADEYGNNVSVINETSLQIQGVAEAGGFPNSLVMDPATGNVYVSNAAEGSISTMVPGLQGLYTLQFTPSGIPASGLQWAISLNGTMQSGTGNLGYLVGNGSYQFDVISSSGFLSCQPKGSFVVDGQPLVLYVSFQSAPCSTGASAIPYLVVGGLAVIVAAAAVVGVRRRAGREEEEEPEVPWPANEP